MIKSYRHKGLELYAKRGDRSKLHQSHVPKIRLILTRLDAASFPEQMNQLGYAFHALKGNLNGFYSVKVSGNWRIVFRFEGNDAIDVDYLDYH
ncbi:type II toxin-antitoxin system RelE/ParE family toxin [Dyadobacter chenwenxiniae]|uniref:Type II toxin-antitoxin system RelE/ParE family toxin n=1 Tax=Dyadobacter chenwenxiniae TaxID=2906456 RepID=A0A9X1TPF4_9BACT|nr:type II toxin-antitoxin system RelE/ParE family toxin [Dyadobacter chenwenxiniae]MCF0065488.1 type II toxin-antitoxin system RelE/ParE family toxin [Dyadobacter chenwenxiniae]UON82104.1 type II toxin-antitoxin system RelE/ParE family toxin [Dyadobacter chenwenxiniae]